MKTKAVAKYIRISPQKARLVADVIRGMNAENAVTTLRFMPKKLLELYEKYLNQQWQTPIRWKPSMSIHSMLRI